MKKIAVISLAVVALLASQIAVAEENDDNQKAASTGVKHGEIATGQVGRVTGGYHAQPAHVQPAHAQTGLNIRGLVRIILLVRVFENLFATTTTPVTKTTTMTTPDVTTTEEPTTTPAPTTADPCLSWPSAQSCRYQIFSGKLTWNQAKASCESMCSSKLAHRNIRNSGDLNTVLGVLSYNNDEMWVGLSDADSAGTADPLWDQTDAETTLDFAGRYSTLAGSVGCGFYFTPQIPATLYSFEECSGTSTFTPDQYLCESCPP